MMDESERDNPDEEPQDGAEREYDILGVGFELAKAAVAIMHESNLSGPPGRSLQVNADDNESAEPASG